MNPIRADTSGIGAVVFGGNGQIVQTAKIVRYAATQSATGAAPCLVCVTNYNRPEVVVVSIDRYAKLKEDARARDPLTALRAEFDRELAVLRTPGTGSKLRKVFASAPAAVAKAANTAARRRKR